MHRRRRRRGGTCAVVVLCDVKVLRLVGDRQCSILGWPFPQQYRHFHSFRGGQHYINLQKQCMCILNISEIHTLQNVLNIILWKEIFLTNHKKLAFITFATYSLMFMQRLMTTDLISFHRLRRRHVFGNISELEWDRPSPHEPMRTKQHMKAWAGLLLVTFTSHTKTVKTSHLATFFPVLTERQVCLAYAWFWVSLPKAWQTSTARPHENPERHKPPKTRLMTWRWNSSVGKHFSQSQFCLYPKWIWSHWYFRKCEGVYSVMICTAAYIRQLCVGSPPSFGMNLLIRQQDTLEQQQTTNTLKNLIIFGLI